MQIATFFELGCYRVNPHPSTPYEDGVALAPRTTSRWAESKCYQHWNSYV